MPVLQRHPAPLLTRHHVPDVPPVLLDATSVFNPGACRGDDGRPLLLLRVQTRGRRSLMMRAVADDAGGFTVEPRLVEVAGLEQVGQPVHHVYDPRITRVEGRWLVTCAMDVDDGCRVGIFATSDFTRLELIAATGTRDTRNGVLFPRLFDGRYLLLERPNTADAHGGMLTGDTIELMSSSDLVTWRTEAPVMQGRWRGWDELIGPGPPPVLTSRGWLLLYHGVATHLGGGLYQAGAAILHRDDPSRVIARTRDNILEPREMYEMVGQVPNVVFPSGLITDLADANGVVPDAAEATVYYGAADTCVGAAMATVGALLDACEAC